MEQDEFAELKHAHVAWVGSKYTQIFIKGIKQQRAAAFRGLGTVCQNTTDPKVAAVYASWCMLDECLASIERGPEHAGQE